ncbi:hypothetical protein A8F94_16785 [Bacillus sp. FJAT-27225]|uniref:YheC/YheD family endospore coat-associated protein n=1 Tax=Bacillus sp. FJAT-27225 TaxID=1743144 RepID=UPI00080C3075|nr:YheC/YheD family protein [Bacillus sp. FJAT-27225]OCA84360.1 hypothetical protein A8F94_16785 [Bacillus sp. FJAT-27225]
MVRYYPIEAIEGDKPIIHFPKSLKLPPSLKKVAFGSAQVEAAFLPHPDRNEEIALSRSIIESLRLPETDLNLRPYSNHDTLYLGPLIGIFTTGVLESSSKPAGGRTDYFSKLLQTCEANGAFGYLFTPQSIDWTTLTIKGQFLANGMWETMLLPFPSAIYDRVPSRRAEQHPQCQYAKEKLTKEYKIPTFNPGFFNKIDIHTKLKQNPKARIYLPETTLFNSVPEARRLLDQYGSIYLKPANGTLGIGICQVIADFPGSACYCRFRNKKGENKLLKFPTLEALASKMFNSRTLKNLLVQQRIALMKVDGRPVDFRVHTNKDGSGQWQVTAIAAKLAGNGSITTHATNGGKISPLHELFGNESTEIETKLTNAALELSHILEEKIDGFAGEFGWDFGIDKNGRVWLFEANSKPGRAIFHYSAMRHSEKQTRKLIIDFAIRLAEKSAVAPQELFL